MRILQLLTQGSGGPADHVADVAPRLAARGHEVVVVMPDGAAADRIDAAGVRRIADSVPRKTDVAGAVRLGREIRALRPDVVHCQDRRAALVARVSKRAARIRSLVYTVHGVPESLGSLVPGNLAVGERRRRDGLYYLTFERALDRVVPSHVVAPSVAVRDYLVGSVGLRSASITVVRNGVDTDRFRPGGDSSDPLRIAWLGLMVPVKRLDVLLAALEATPSVRAVLAGDGPLRADVERAALPLGDRVELPGFVADPSELLREAGGFVLCSAAENCPLALLQAMASGLPVIATRVGGVPEVVEDGVTGLLVPPGDAVALGAALGRLAGDAPLRSRLGAAARERAVRELDLDLCVRRLEAVYERTARL